MKYISPLSLLILINCSPSFEQELRIERVRSEKTTPIENETPLWTAEFEKEIFDGDTYLPSHIYDHILGKLHKLSHKAIRKRTLEGFNPDNPPDSRGKFWRISGVIARIWPEEIPDSHSPLSPNTLNVTESLKLEPDSKVYPRYTILSDGKLLDFRGIGPCHRIPTPLGHLGPKYVDVPRIWAHAYAEIHCTGNAEYEIFIVRAMPNAMSKGIKNKWPSPE